jgi:hypothetical protein
MDWIDDNIAVGSWLDAEEVAERKEKGVDLVLDARALFHRKKGLHPFVIEPIPEKVLRAADLLISLSNYKNSKGYCVPKILVRCIWGVDRTPFLAAVYVKQKYDKTWADAYKYVAAKHPQTQFHWDWIEMLDAGFSHDKLEGDNFQR